MGLEKIVTKKALMASQMKQVFAQANSNKAETFVSNFLTISPCCLVLSIDCSLSAVGL